MSDTKTPRLDETFNVSYSNQRGREAVKAAVLLDIAALEKCHAAKVTALSDEIRNLQNEVGKCRMTMNLIFTDKEGVWFWQGDGKDDVPSLSCPVVMSADTLRAIEARHASELVEAVANAIKMCNEEKNTTLKGIGGLLNEQIILEVKQAREEAYEDAAQLVFNETMEGSVATAAERVYSKLREKAGRL